MALDIGVNVKPTVRFRLSAKDGRDLALILNCPINRTDFDAKGRALFGRSVAGFRLVQHMP